MSESVRLQLNEIEIRESSKRQTPVTSFGHVLKSGMLAGHNVLRSAGYAIPGAAIVGAAISGVGAVQDVAGGVAEGAAGGSGLSTGIDGTGLGGGAGALGTGSLGGGSGALGAVAGRAAAGDQASQMMMATQQMQEMNQTFNLQYLQLQQKMQSESRDYTAMSNIMKTKHDTARNALSNLK